MCETIVEKFEKKPMNPQGTGILRFKVLEILLRSTRPLTVRQICGELHRAKAIYCQGTVYNIIRELSTGIPSFELRSRNVRTGDGKSRAYTIHLTTPINGHS